MKYKVSVIKKIAFLVMTMALAVAMVACQAATPKGAQGDPGDTGPAGPPGTTDNELPMAVPDKPFQNVYLALGGTGDKNPSDPIDPSGHFMDKENASLTYKADSSDEDVATVKVDDAGKLTITGKKAGMTTIMVKAYDGVNEDPGMGSFDVIVVSNNALPVVDFPRTDVTFTPATAQFPANGLPDLEAKIYTKNGDSVVTVMVAIDAGAAGTLSDEVTVKAVMGTKGNEDDIVSVGLAEKKRGTWEITLTPKAPGMQNVALKVEDKFGRSVDFGAPFTVLVNTVPELVIPLPDRTIAVAAIGNGTIMVNTAYILKEFFDLDEKAPTGDPASSSATSDIGIGVATELPGAPADADYTCTASMNDKAIATVMLVGDIATVTAVKAGKAELTVTCRDTEDSVSDTAMITVR